MASVNLGKQVTKVSLILVFIAVFRVVQWNLSITTTSKIKYITFDLFSDVF